MLRGRTRTTRSTLCRWGSLYRLRRLRGRAKAGDPCPLLARPIYPAEPRAPPRSARAPPVARPGPPASRSSQALFASASDRHHLRSSFRRPQRNSGACAWSTLHDARGTHAARRDGRAPSWSGPVTLASLLPNSVALMRSPLGYVFVAAYSTYEREWPTSFVTYPLVDGC